jgi:predicted transcriptional regulator
LDEESLVTRREDPLETLLGPLEQDVMDAVWKIGDATVRDVHDLLKAERQIAYTTVMTTMTRLAAKKMLERDTAGLAHRYSATVSRDTYARSTVGHVLSWLLERYPEPAASYLAEVVDEAATVDLNQLRAAVARQRDTET